MPVVVWRSVLEEIVSHLDRSWSDWYGKRQESEEFCDVRVGV